MSYKINRTDGSLLVELIDGRIDEDTTDITLVGRNYTGYGEIFNENLIKMLENFRSTTPPVNPLMGQVWFDSSVGRLKVYNGNEWKSTDTTNVSSSEPELSAGDVWIDSGNKQIFFSDGTDTILAGPNYTALQGKTGFDAVTLTDTFGVKKTVSRFSIGNNTVAIITRQGFQAAANAENEQILSGIPVQLKSGWNINPANSAFAFNGLSTTATQLNDPTTGLNYTPANFLNTIGNNTTSGTLLVRNDGGITYGLDSDFNIRIEQNSTVFRNRIEGSFMQFQVKDGIFDQDAIHIKALVNEEYRIGLWNNNPQYSLDLTGNMRVTGNLIVEGDTINAEVQNLIIEDKQIELARSGDSALFSDNDLDGAGLLIKSQDGDKEIVWQNTVSGQFYLSDNVNIPANKAYRIDDQLILNETQLGASVTSAPGITELGTLTELNVDTLSLDGSSIISLSSGLILKSITDITVLDGTNATGGIKIQGVASPESSDSDDVVATKGYVEGRIYSDADVRMTLDITGLTGDSDIALLLEDLYPVSGKTLGIYAYVHTISYTAGVTFNGGTGASKTFVAVDKNGVENQSVLQDIGFSNQTETIDLAVTRALKRFQITEPSPGVKQWNFIDNLVSSV